MIPMWGGVWWTADHFLCGSAQPAPEFVPGFVPGYVPWPVLDSACEPAAGKRVAEQSNDL